MKANVKLSKETSLIRLAISAQQTAFFYLYRFRYYAVVEEKLSVISLQKRPWSWKLIPWLLSMVFLIAASGIGSTSYVWLGFLFNLHPRKFSFQTVGFNTWLCICGTVTQSVLLVIHYNPLVLNCFNELFLEKRCKSMLNEVIIQITY